MDRLTNQIKPKNIFMGQKDLQQLILVKKFIEKKYNVKIISCKTVRDQNGVALSSRNVLLKKKEFHVASSVINKTISLKKKFRNQKNINSFLENKKRSIEKKYNIKIEYLELRNKINLKKTDKIKNSKLFIAYNLGKIRLIDNI